MNRTSSKNKKSVSRKRIVLLDAHALLHRAYHALPEFTSSQGIPTGGLYGFLSMILRIMQELQPDHVIACYDLPQKTFRHEAYDAYKGTRGKTDDALKQQIEASRAMCETLSLPIYDVPGFEADDMLGTIVEQTKFMGDAENVVYEVIIATGDMDSLQLVEGDRVTVYTLKKGINDTILYDEEKVRERFGFGPEFLADYKGLRGDPSDNIIGVPGIGEKTATELILSFEHLENLFEQLHTHRETFLEKGIKERIVKLLEEHEEGALFSKTLATIRRDAPITFVVPEKLWRETCSFEKVEDMLIGYEFKSLVSRFKAVFSGEVTSETSSKKTSQEEVINTEENTDEYRETLRKAKIALWLIDSEKTQADTSDIFAYTRTKNISAALDILEQTLHEEELWWLYEQVELPLIPLLDRMQKYGVLVDREFLKKLSHEFHEELTRYEKKIYEHAGHEFNINSPKQLGEIVFGEMQLHTQIKGFRIKKTATGAYSTKESDLEKLSGTHPIIEDIFSYRELQKLLSTYIDNLPDMLDEQGRLHPELLQTGTTTGRFSSQNPNIQNIPIRGEQGKKIREAFIAAPGHTLIVADYSQIELRAAAMLSGDKVLLEAFQTGKDIHTSVAANIFHVPESEVTADMRRKAKVINFGILYGMGVSALQKNLGTSRKEAQEYYDEYFRSMSGLSAYLDNTLLEAQKKGYTQTIFGRRRMFPGLRSTIPFIKAMAERAANNAPIQGMSADIIKIAMVELDREFTRRSWHDRVHMIMQIHDELVFEVSEDLVLEASEMIRSVMESVIQQHVQRVAHSVPLLVSLETGFTWGSAKD